MRINWKVFDGNSSTEATVADFASGEIKTHREWIRRCGHREARQEVRRIRHHKGITIGQVRQRARRRGLALPFS